MGPFHSKRVAKAIAKSATRETPLHKQVYDAAKGLAEWTASVVAEGELYGVAAQGKRAA